MRTFCPFWILAFSLRKNRAVVAPSTTEAASSKGILLGLTASDIPPLAKPW
jgi:hypothetical protein